MPLKTVPNRTKPVTTPSSEPDTVLDPSWYGQLFSQALHSLVCVWGSGKKLSVHAQLRVHPPELENHVWCR